MKKLNELRITKDLKSKGFNQKINLKRSLKSYGWEILGTGNDAVVAEHPDKKYVLKIFDNQSYFSEFLEFVKNHQNNPHLPKFSRFVRKVPGTDFDYVRMEKLDKIDRINLKLKFFCELAYLYGAGLRKNIQVLAGDLLYDISSNIYFTAIDSELFDTKEKISRDDITWNHVQKVMEIEKCNIDNEWKSMVDDFISYSSSIRMQNFDLHSSNFMTRDNTLVIIDPYCIMNCDGKRGRHL